MKAAARTLSAIPLRIGVLLLAALTVQIVWQARPAPQSRIAELPPAPSALLLHAASFGEPELAARVAMLYLQAYDLRGDNTVPYQRLDYARLVAWLRSILRVDPRSSYALFSAARIYAENPDANKCRAVLEFLYEAFLADPDRRWPWLAHAALLAKHRLRDLPLALRYAQAIDCEVRDGSAPLWAKQIQAFILKDLKELEAAKVMLGENLQRRAAVDPTDAYKLH